jgi:hypothetical protein
MWPRSDSLHVTQQRLAISPSHFYKELSMRSILLLLLGVPIPIVILIALFSH